MSSPSDRQWTCLLRTIHSPGMLDVIKYCSSGKMSSLNSAGCPTISMLTLTSSRTSRSWPSKGLLCLPHEMTGKPSHLHGVRRMWPRLVHMSCGLIACSHPSAWAAGDGGKDATCHCTLSLLCLRANEEYIGSGLSRAASAMRRSL